MDFISHFIAVQTTYFLYFIWYFIAAQTAQLLYFILYFIAVETALSAILCVFSAAQTAYNSEVLQLSPSDRTVPTIKEEEAITRLSIIKLIFL